MLRETGSWEASYAEVLILAKDGEDLCWDKAKVGGKEEERFEN